MLHDTRINFRRRIVNQTRRFSCRAAAQFNHPATGKAGVASLFAIEYLCPGLPEPGRWADKL